MVLLINNMTIDKDKIIEVLKNEKVICWSDIIEKLDLLPLFKKYQDEHNKLYSIKKVYMGQTLLNWIEEILKARIVKSKDKRVRYLKEQYRLSSLGFDALQSMPTVHREDIDYMLLEDL